MIRLATAFSGIGAIEHALNRMGLENEIVLRDCVCSIELKLIMTTGRYVFKLCN